jgi:hypothetical protein
LASAGAAIVSAFFSTVSWRRSSGASSTLSNCVARLAKPVTAVM